jgi:hypothetical protein
MTLCECTIPDGGYCERHAIHKTAHWVELCQTRQAYWQAWEEGWGPTQNIPAVAVPATPASTPPGGPGSELKKILSWFGITDIKGCPCRDHARTMDRWGPDVCEEQMPKILRWLKQESRRRNLPFNAWLADKVVRLAIRRARERRSLLSSE